MDLKMNRYILNPGVIIRIGRVGLRIRNIIISKRKKCKTNNNTSLNESNTSNYNIKEMYQREERE